LQELQDTGAAVYDATETGNAIESELKRLSEYNPVRLDVIFEIESRTGTETAGTASTLTDTGKSQFLAADATNEKRIHNTTDDTWAVVTAWTSTSVVSLSADIMDSGESYEIFNKRCRNKKQIYIGDMPSYLWVETVEYPLGIERNFILVEKDIIELEVDDSTIPDTDSTLTSPNAVDVLVKFAMPQVVCQLADLLGEVHTAGVAGATTLQVKYFTDDQIIEVGEYFNIDNHRTTYIVTTGVTLDLQTSTGKPISFFPGLEAAAPSTEHLNGITFVKSTLKSDEEEILIALVVAALKVSYAEGIRKQSIDDMTTGRALIPTINVGGSGVATRYLEYAKTGLQVANELVKTATKQRDDLRQSLESLATPRMAKVLPRGTVSE